MSRIFRIATLLFILSLTAVSCNRSAPPPDTKPPITTAYNVPAQLGNAKLFLEIAKTDQAQQQGLSGRQQLTEEQGMLFDFRDTAETRPAFWMKDMKFDLDLVWLKNNKVVEITTNVLAPKNEKDALPTYAPSSDIDMVLEVNSGWAARHNIKQGQTLDIQSIGQL